MNASVTMRQAGQSKKMAEARLSFEERKTIIILIQLFPFLKCVYIFWHPLYIYIFILLSVMLACFSGYTNKKRQPVSKACKSFQHTLQRTWLIHSESSAK
jgi:hypothetical protein